MKFRVHTSPDYVTRDLRLWIVAEDRNGEATATKIVMEKFDPSVAPPADSGRIIDRSLGSQRDFLQAMLDGAWEAGLRPTGYGNVAEALKASDAHLQDMRAIAFGKLGIQKP